MAVQRPLVRYLRLSGVPILHQLQLEEALLRNTKDNWFLLNDGAAAAAIVMGISGRVEELVDAPTALARRLAVVKRFTGGGTVVVDHDTVFASLIMQADAVPGLDCFPQPIMRWSEGFYGGVFASHGDFCLREHDYVFGERKFGGNAQAIVGRRWLHHTSLLWDYDARNMAALKNPARQPAYRARRGHGEFVMRLRDALPGGRGALLAALEANAAARFDLAPAPREAAEAALNGEYLRGNRVVVDAPQTQGQQGQQQR